VLATCATTLAVALIASLGIWQAVLHGPSSSHGAMARPVATQMLSHTFPAASGSVRPVPRSLAPQLILVDSTEQAVRLQQGLDMAAALRSQTGVGPLDERVLQINGDDEVDTAMRAVADENGFRAVLGLAPIEVIDLRRVTLSAPAAVRSSASSSRAMAGQLPGSLDQETLQRLRIEEGQLAITRALAGEVLPNFSPAAQAAIEQGQQAITRAMAREAPPDSR